MVFLSGLWFSLFQGTPTSTSLLTCSGSTVEGLGLRVQGVEYRVLCRSFQISGSTC